MNQQYKKPQLEEADQAPDFQRIYRTFHNALPTNFHLNSHTILTQCLAHNLSSSPSSQTFSAHRKPYLLIANNLELLLMEIQQGQKQKITRNKFIRILFEDIVCLRLSVFYCGVIVVYEQYQGAEQRRQHAINLESVELGGQRKGQLRQHLVKFVGAVSRGQRERLEEYSVRTLLDFQRLGEEGMDGDGELAGDGDRVVTGDEIRRTRVVNLRKRKEEVIRKFSSEISKNDGAKLSLDRMYRILAEITHKNQTPKPYKLYIAQTPTNPKPPHPQLHTLKLYPKPAFTLHPNTLPHLHTECTIHKTYKIITPYIPTLTRVLSTPNSVILQYKYYEVYSIGELLAKGRLDGERKAVRELLAEIVVAVGHVHQCGFVYRLDGGNCGVGGDGHVLLLGVGGVERVRGKDRDGVEKEQRKIKREIVKMAPEELQMGQNSPQTVSDWWFLGLLIYEIVVGSPYFQNLTQQKIKQTLLDKKELDLQYFDKKIPKTPQLSNLTKSLLQKNPAQRIGHKNDYHTILDHPYFKGVDKKKLMKRETEPIMKVKLTKIQGGKEIWVQEQRRDGEMREIDREVQRVIEECVFDQSLEFQ